MKKRTLTQNVSILHLFYKRRGVYKFVYISLVKLLIGLGVLGLVVLLLQNFVPSSDEWFAYLVSKFSTVSLLVIFFLSETFFGLIPPDLFIVWGETFEYPYLIVGVLAVMSYCGGMCSYFIGKSIGKMPKVEKWLTNKFEDHLIKFRKWGGVFIVIAALFPLPFSPICMLAGLINYRFSQLLLLGLFRFLRFFGYALVLFALF